MCEVWSLNCGFSLLNHKVSAQDAALPKIALTCRQQPDFRAAVPMNHANLQVQACDGSLDVGGNYFLFIYLFILGHQQLEMKVSNLTKCFLP